MENNNLDKFGYHKAETNDIYNASGCKDVTAYKAVKKAEEDAEVERFKKLLGCIFRICEIAGFQIEEHLVIRDKRTGRLWK